MALRNSLQSPATGYSAGSATASSSSLVTPSLTLLADPPVRYSDGAAMDYLLIEMVPILRASAAFAKARERRIEKEMIDAGLVPPPPLRTAKEKEREKEKRESTGSAGTRGSMTGTAGTTVASAEDIEDEGLRIRLEAVGVHVGSNIVERLCRQRPRFGDTLDAVKFVCKDVWDALWDKQVDNLRTNHRGVYVLQDNAFKPISRISSYEGAVEAARRAKIYVAMPAGVIRGALARMGFQATVSPEIPHLPQCTFQVKMPRT